MLKNWKPGPVDVVIIVGAVVNLIVIALIVVYHFTR